ncbi:PRC-barrel domain-containing protein [Natroniella sulfidigena]|uniref:PRC-barrel domain-containing protein n=1 Tax=Natroniella sulfidigena TaxID=723921 RepID=UPI00200B13A4|nr:PRC-barrel domain-containing protein [Natroniella sulfidigena]MCK8818097.1 PRC-barrel domain-containing protein [Natroniella sulfidigena]
MRRGQELIGLPIVDLEDGELIGKVVDILFSPEKKELLGVKAKNNKLWKGARLIPQKSLYTLGKDIVVINNKRDLKQAEKSVASLNSGKEVMGKEVITEEGQVLGAVEDVIIDQDQKLLGYELTDGLIQDILTGRKLILFAEIELTYGEDIIIVTNGN